MDSNRKVLWIVAAVLALLVIGGVWWYSGHVGPAPQQVEGVNEPPKGADAPGQTTDAGSAPPQGGERGANR